MMAIRLPTGTVAPGAIKTFRRMPLPKASSSMSALSVSISATMSPPEIRSPSCLSQRKSLPVSIASDSFGMTTLVTAMGARSSVRSDRAELAEGVDDPVLRGGLQPLEVPGVRHGRVGAADPPYRRVEIVEGALRDEGGDLGPHSGEPGARLRDQGPVGLPHGRQDGLGVHRPE